jgi:hypothetical protein
VAQELFSGLAIPMNLLKPHPTDIIACDTFAKEKSFKKENG